MKNVNYWLVLCCLLVVGVHSATAQQDWIPLLQKVNQSIKQEPQQAIHLEYTQTLIPRASKEAPQVVTVELRQQGKRQSKIASQMSYFADEQNAYAIYPDARKIFVLNAWQRAQRQLQEGATGMDIQQLWKGADIQEIKAEQTHCQRVQIVPTKAMQRLGQVLKIELEFDRRTHVLRQSTLHLPTIASYQQVVFDYTYVHKAKDIALFKTAKDQVFDHQGKLLKKYQQFAVEQR